MAQVSGDFIKACFSEERHRAYRTVGDLFAVVTFGHQKTLFKATCRNGGQFSLALKQAASNFVKLRYRTIILYIKQSSNTTFNMYLITSDI